MQGRQRTVEDPTSDHHAPQRASGASHQNAVSDKLTDQKMLSQVPSEGEVQYTSENSGNKSNVDQLSDIEHSDTPSQFPPLTEASGASSDASYNDQSSDMENSEAASPALLLPSMTT